MTILKKPVDLQLDAPLGQDQGFNLGRGTFLSKYRFARTVHQKGTGQVLESENEDRRTSEIE